MSRVRGCVTNNWGFWIWWLGLFYVCITLKLNYNCSHLSVFSRTSLLKSWLQCWTIPTLCLSKSKSESKSLRLTVSQSVSFGVEPIFITLWQLRCCFSGAPPLTRGRVCVLYMLLALASVVFLGSESLGTCGHILLSQIWDFPFRGLLRLAGTRWRYSNPPPHCQSQSYFTIGGLPSISSS
jgi:hypothetical protein